MKRFKLFFCQLSSLPLSWPNADRLAPAGHRRALRAAVRRYQRRQALREAPGGAPARPAAPGGA